MSLRPFRVWKPLCVNQLGDAVRAEHLVSQREAAAFLTLTKYGRFLPSSADRQKWEEAATTYEETRRQAR
jgi:hypothetical protein